MTGSELRQAIATKWEYSYDVQLRKTQGKIFLQVMWRYQEQQSFSMGEAEFIQHLDAIAAYLKKPENVEKRRQARLDDANQWAKLRNS
jgi:hypothetical protein